MIRRYLLPIATVIVCSSALLGTSAAHAEPAVKIRVSDNVMLLDLSPARIDTHANFHEIFRSLRRAKQVRSAKEEVAEREVTVALVENRRRG